MERHWMGKCVVVIALVGCSRSSEDRATAPPAMAQSQGGSLSDASAAAEPETPAFRAGEPAVIAPGLPSFAIVREPDGVPAAAEPVPAAASPDRFAPVSRGEPASRGEGGNPLRFEMAPAPPLPGNPLRLPSDAAGGGVTIVSPLDLPAAPATGPSGGSAPSELPPAAPQALAANQAAAKAKGNDLFDVVQVFYGTDRQCTEPDPRDWASWVGRFIPAACAVLATFVLGLAALARRSFVLCLLAVAAVACAGGLGYQAGNATLAAVRRLGSTGPHYTTARAAGGRVDLGICEISIPRTHAPGEVESPSITRLEVRPDAARHIVLSKTERLMESSYYAILRERVHQSPRKELFVFVHGFNVSFDDAARRTAQIHHDLKFPGAPIFFSWPANDKFIFSYPADETNVAWSAPHLKKFLLEIVQYSEAQSINLIAHSMGNRALAAALREIDLEMRGQARLFNQVILAAPDIDAEDFRLNIAPAMQRTAKQMTLYASSRDDALLASQLVHRGPRAGDAGSGLVLVNGVDTIDVTAIDSSPWGHSYYGSSDPVLNDLKELFFRAVPPRDRSWLSPAQRDGLTYWVFQATRTAGAGDDKNR